MTYTKIKFLFLFLAIVLSTVQIEAEGDVNHGGGKLNKISGTPSRTRLNINNISTWIYNNGNSDIDPNGNSGLIFPKGSNKGAVFESGFVWGADVNGEKRVGGSTYSQGLIPGAILPNGQREDENASHVRIYRVRPDWNDPNVDFSSEVNDGEGTEAEVKAQYEKDWNEWPVAYGAPYEDVDGNGQFNADVDKPGFPGANQTIWYVANDLDSATCQSLYGSDPMGIEMQATFWSYKSSSALGNTFFRKYVIINKSADTFEDMYVSMWSDVDLGDAGDDYSGCDVEKSLMFTYNGDADDGVYGKTPPATGFDFFQGPIVPGEPTDEAIFNNKVKTGYKNLPMSAHYFFINSDPIYADPDLGDYVNGTLQFHNLFRGLISGTGQPFVDPTTGEDTKFTLSGDPVTGQGWVDGLLHSPGDRRQGMVSGPFTMAPGDTQEIVVAELVAGAFGSVDRLGAVQLLKFYDLEAQSAYDNFFKVPESPKAPVVTVSEMDEEVVLIWDQDAATRQAIENYDALGYKFQGYVVYQYPSANAQFEDAKIVATYDLVDGIGKVIGPQFDVSGGVVLDKVLKFGSDSGIKRYITLKEDLFKGNTPLNNGTPYYYAVTAYCVNEDLGVVPNYLESPVIVKEIIPQTLKPGESAESEVEDAIQVAHSTGVSDGVVNVKVVDPKAVTGDNYRVDFAEDEAGTISWNLVNVTSGATVLANQTNLSGVQNTYLIAEGLQVAPQSASAEIKGAGNALVEVAYGGVSPVKTDAGGAPYGGNKVWHSLNSTNDYYISAGGGTGGLDRLYRWVTYASPRDFELRFTEAGGFGIYAFTDDKICTVPFELWDIGVATVNDPSDDIRMIPFIVENDSTKPFWGYATGTDPYFGYAESDWIYWMDPKDATPGSVGYDQFANSCTQSGGAGAIYDYQYDTDPTAGDYNANFYGGFVYPWGRMTVCDYAQDGTPPPAGTTVRIITSKPVTANDKFTFTAPDFSTDAAQAKEDVKKINVFPNPYYGVNPNEINKYQRYVTFNHLPAKATIRLFNMGGQLVSTIEKDDATQFARWNLQNDNGLPVASGVYIAYIDMPGLGKTKIVKVAIIQETQILDRF